MSTRAENAAATRRALLDAAGALLDLGGPEAVTLRGVGGLAGVSRSAPYRHFPSKDDLLTELSMQAWDDLGNVLEALARANDIGCRQRLSDALSALIEIGRARPHLYRLMFTTPNTDPAAAIRAAARTHDLFLQIVAEVVGPKQAQAHGALLLTTAHGIAGLELSGHLTFDKWQVTSADLIDLQIELLPAPRTRSRPTPRRRPIQS